MQIPSTMRINIVQSILQVSTVLQYLLSVRILQVAGYHLGFSKVLSDGAKCFCKASNCLCDDSDSHGVAADLLYFSEEMLQSVMP